VPYLSLLRLTLFALIDVVGKVETSMFAWPLGESQAVLLENKNMQVCLQLMKCGPSFAVQGVISHLTRERTLVLFTIRFTSTRLFPFFFGSRCEKGEHLDSARVVGGDPLLYAHQGVSSFPSDTVGVFWHAA
jgi:hypothetical protein